MQKKSYSPTTNAILLTILGAACLLVGYFVFLPKFSAPNNDKTTMGIVISKAVTVNSKGTTYAYKVSYSVNGQHYITENLVDISMDVPKGGKVEVAYNPTNPASAEIVPDKSGAYQAYTVIGIGIIGVVAGPVYYVLQRKKSQQAY